jgi:hypothetical protein
VLGEPSPLFEKLDEKEIEAENARLGTPWRDPDGPIAEQSPQERVVIYNGEIRRREDLGQRWAY